MMYALIGSILLNGVLAGGPHLEDGIADEILGGVGLVLLIGGLKKEYEFDKEKDEPNGDKLK
ncbi:hypothetical protein [Leptothoe spongobia]|nr:hypothetical protein [Leptothoe spongobia]